MSSEIDYKDISQLIIESMELTNVDDIYTFFYDETNNSRKFRITENDFNSSKDDDFVLGGLVYDGIDKPLNIDELCDKFRLQPNVKEIKRKHVASGDTFYECVSSNKLQVLLEWLINNKIYIHFMAMNNLFFWSSRYY